MILKHVLNNQKEISRLLFLIFIGLLLLNIFIPSIDIDIPLATISGWLGVVIGFFFNQQISSLLNEQLKQIQQRKNLYADSSNEKFESLVKTYDEILFKKEQEISEIIKHYESKKK